MDPLHVVRTAVASYVGESGKAPSDPETLEAINEARRILYPLGDWRNTITQVALQVYENTITLPPWADVIRKGQLYGCRGHMDIENHWYAVVPEETYTSSRGRCLPCYGNNPIDLGAHFASFQPYTKNFRIKVVALDSEDKGVRLVFHAVSEYGEPLLLTRILGDPLEPVIADPINDKWVKSFSACNKPITKDRVLVYIFDPVREVDTLCAIYEATDVNPQMRRYRLPRGYKGPVLATVKKKFVELVNNDELVDIHTDALIHVLMGITARKNRSPGEYATQIKAARDFLDKQINNSQPMKTSTVRMGSAYRITNLGFE